MNAVLLVSTAVVILLVGGGIGFWIGRSGIGGSKARVDKAEAELEEYKRNVSQHFGQTAAHFQAIGKQYRELYDHMANGAEALCEPDDAGAKLLFAPGADAASTDLKEQAADTAREAEARSPRDYAEQPAAEEAANDREVPEEPTDETTADIAAEAESTETDVVDESVPEKTAESQTEAKDDKATRTLH